MEKMGGDSMNNTQEYFVSDICFDLPTVRELSAHFMPAWRKWATAAFVVFALAYVVFYAVAGPWILKWGCGACLITMGLVTLRYRDGGKGYRKLLEQTGGVPKRNLVYIREEGIRYRNPETENTVDIDYRDITGITRTKSFFLLTRADGQRNLLSHANLTGGTAGELELWLLERTRAEKISRTLDNRIFRKALFWIMGAGLVMGLVLEGGLFAPQPRAMTVSEATWVLSELGIRVPETDIEDDLPSEYVMEELLFLAGMGEYDYDTFTWTPAKSGVYAFDLEVFDVGNMYTDFLRGVEAMSGGELVFTAVTEDDSHVDIDTGLGWKEVTFTVSGQTRTLRAEMLYDWFDPSFANAVAELTEDHRTGKRLRFWFDGYQLAYVFWGDEAWTGEFTKATGLALTDKLE